MKTGMTVLGLTAVALTVGAAWVLNDKKTMNKLNRAVSKAVDNTVSSVKDTANKVSNNVNNMKTY